MKKLIAVLLIAAMLTGCGKNGSTFKGEWSEELTSLMSTINAEHQQVEKVDMDYSPYFQTPYENIPDTGKQGYTFTKAEIVRDMDYLFEMLQKEYGPYDYYGGDEVFLPAKEVIVAQCSADPYLTEDKFLQIFAENLPMVKDMHLRFNYHVLDKSSIYPYYNTDVIFQKTEEGFVNADGRTVAFVEGYDSPDEVIRRSLSKEGDLVYYLIILDMIDGNDDNERSTVVHYTDGSSETLTCKIKRSAYLEHKNYNTHEKYVNHGIPTLFTKHMESSSTLSTAKEFSYQPVSIVNLTCSSMGNILNGSTWTTIYNWMKEYAGEAVPSNMKAIFRRSSGNVEQLPEYSVEGNEAVVFGQEDAFIENENLLVILTSKLTDGDSEIFVDMAHNLENTLIIGNNTHGSCISSWDIEVKLPNTGMLVHLGGNLNLWPEGHFEELYGLEPDIWCPESIAEEAAINFIKKNVQ